MSDYTTITERILALGTQENRDVAGAFVSRDEVLAIVANAVPVEIDADMYADTHHTVVGQDKETLAVISTVYNLLADKAAEFAARFNRRRIEAVGMDWMPDAELFAKNKANPFPGAVTSYRDLAPRNQDRVLELGDIFQRLIDESTADATAGLLLSLSRDLTAGDSNFLDVLLRGEGEL